MKKVLVTMALGLFCGSLFATSFDYEACRKHRSILSCVAAGSDCKVDNGCRCVGPQGCLPGAISAVGTPEHKAYQQVMSGKAARDNNVKKQIAN